MILKPSQWLLKTPSSKQTFLKQWGPKIAGSKLIVNSQNAGVGGKLSLAHQPPNPAI